MAKIGTISVEMAEFVATDFDTNQLTLVFNPSLPMDGSIVFASVVPGSSGIQFDDGSQRKLIFLANGGAGRIPIHFNGNAYNAKVNQDETWAWVQMVEA